jgi:hypothetical protein
MSSTPAQRESCANSASVTGWAVKLNAKGRPRGRVKRDYGAVTDRFTWAIEGRTFGQ